MSPIGYHSGSTVLRALDVRVKFALLALLSLAVVQAGLLHVTLLLSAQMVLMSMLGISLTSLCSALRHLLFLFAVVWLVRALTSPGDALVHIGWFSLSRQGVAAGSLVVARMLLVVLLGIILIITTRPSEIKAAVEWFLKPVPGIPRARIATMLGLLLRLIPLLIAQGSETLDAQRARAVENRKNPLYRLTWFAIPFLRRSFVAVDRLSMAMEARCYTDDRTPFPLAAARRDWLVLSVGLVYTIIVLTA